MGERMNNLTGKEWLQYSFSIWKDIEKTNGERKLKHPAMFPTQLTSRLIQIHTKNKGEVVLDPFLGSGSTVVSAYKLGRKGIGFELSKEYIKLSESRIKETQLNLEQKPEDLIKPEIYNKTIFDIPKTLKENSVDLVIISPPYWDILNAKRSADRKEIRNVFLRFPKKIYQPSVFFFVKNHILGLKNKRLRERNYVKTLF